MRKVTHIWGNSDCIKSLKGFIQKAASSDLNVLIQGETGVGKELTARMIHKKSSRSNHAFVKINCANLNENLLESEIFGYKKGAYTGAHSDKAGLLEEAQQGTFFMDEIGDISLRMQAKFLSVIEDRQIRRLGENKTREIEVRFIFATNTNLTKMVTQGKFRKDLFYRVCILNTEIRPLRDRKSDIPILVDKILSQIEPIPKTVAKESLEKLMKHTFPGNIRELENIIHRAVLLSDTRSIEKEHIQFIDLIEQKKPQKNVRFSFDEVMNALLKCKGNKSQAAKELGISRVHFYRILSRFRDGME